MESLSCNLSKRGGQRGDSSLEAIWPSWPMNGCLIPCLESTSSKKNGKVFWQIARRLGRQRGVYVPHSATLMLFLNLNHKFYHMCFPPPSQVRYLFSVVFLFHLSTSILHALRNSTSPPAFAITPTYHSIPALAMHILCVFMMTVAHVVSSKDGECK